MAISVIFAGEIQLLGNIKKVLVTGGTGFLGAYIIRELVEKGYAVTALRRKSTLPFFIPATVFEKVEWIEGDLFDMVAIEEAVQGVDAIIHAAAMVSFHKKDRGVLYKTNVEGTANIVNAAIDNNIARLVHVSSVAAIGRTAGGGEVTEGKKWSDSHINTHYAISKYKAEMEVWRGMGEGLNVAIVNPSTIIGYGDWNQSSCAIFKNVYQEFPWYTDGINGFVAVEDVAKATVLLMESDISGERYILNGENIAFRELFNTIADGFNKKKPTRKATALMGAIAWRIESVKAFFSGKKPLLTRETAKVAQSITNFNNSKILAALPGFYFTPLKESITKACKNYLNPVQPL